MNTQTSQPLPTLVEQYLNAVDQALREAKAPIADRLSVLQELESQLHEMVSTLAEPISEACVLQLIDNLETPATFAEPYEVHATRETHGRNRFFTWRKLFTLASLPIVILCLLTNLFTHVMEGPITSPFNVLVFFPSFLVAYIGAPWALWSLAHEIRHDGMDDDHKLFAGLVAVYGVTAIGLLLLLVIVLSAGMALIPIGAIASLVALNWVYRRIAFRTGQYSRQSIAAQERQKAASRNKTDLAQC
jgi:hypothetical protein